MTALHGPLSIGADADLLPANSRQDFVDLSVDTCRKYAKLPTSSRHPSSPRKQPEGRTQLSTWPGWSAHANKMLSSSLVHHDGGVGRSSSNASASAYSGSRHYSRDSAEQRRSQAYSAISGFDEACETAKPPSPPPAPPLPALSNSDRRGSFTYPAASSQASPTNPETISKRTVPIWEWCANMVCYIWFAGSAPEPAHISAMTTTQASTPPCRSPTAAFNAPLQSSPLANRRHRKSDSLGSLSECSKFSAHDLSQAMDAHLRASADPVRSPSSVAADSRRDPMSLRLSARHRFKLFVKDLLNTTQVSKSVILLALLYIHRLKSRHPGLRGEEGSEFRLFITALMLGNKFLDDHTYTNKTWSELSGIELKDITRMEVEFWLGLSMSIYVSDVDFRHWIKTLEQLAQRRQQALVRREQEAARRTAQRQQQKFQRQQQQQQIQRHQNVRRQLQYARASPTLPWSPQHAYHSDGGGSPYRAAVSAMAAFPLSPSMQILDDAYHKAPMDNRVLAYPTPADADALNLLAVSVDANCATSPDINALRDRKCPEAYQRAGELSSTFAANKRTLAAVQDGAADHFPPPSPSPERPRKRLAAFEPSTDSTLRLQRASLSPCAYGLVQQPDRDASVRPVHSGISPISNQPFPRSVFEPLVTTPNTLLAPYVFHQPAVPVAQHRHHPLAYWQLAAGHDRGILGVHLPAPIPSTSEYFTPTLDAGRRGSGANTGSSPPLRLASRRAVNTTTPYPTPNLFAEQNGFGNLAAVDQLVPILDDARFDGQHQRAAVFSPAALADGKQYGYDHSLQALQMLPQHHLQPQHHLYHAPHAPFNNAECNYVDPFARYM